MSFLGYPNVIPYTKFEHFGIFRFWVMLRTNEQIDKQTDGAEHATQADRFCLRNNLQHWRIQDFRLGGQGRAPKARGSRRRRRRGGW